METDIAPDLVAEEEWKKMECKYNETYLYLITLMNQDDSLRHAYDTEIRKMHQNTWDHFQKMLNEHEKLKLEVDYQRKELEIHGNELEERVAQTTSEGSLLIKENNKSAMRNHSLQMATLEHKKADENVLSLVVHHKREKEDLHKKLLQLEKQMNAKQALELEIELLKRHLNVRKHMGGDYDLEVKEKVEAIVKNLEEKEEKLEDLVKEKESNDEMQGSRKEFINVMENLGQRTMIGVKSMGELNSKMFQNSCKRKYSSNEAVDKSVELCSLWENHLRNPEWRPFKIVKVEDVHQKMTLEEIVDHEDEKLKGLKEEFGDEVYNAIIKALEEMKEYNPRGRFAVPELWNFRKGKKATLKEGVTFISKQWRARRRKRR